MDNYKIIDILTLHELILKKKSSHSEINAEQTEEVQKWNKMYENLKEHSSSKDVLDDIKQNYLKNQNCHIEDKSFDFFLLSVLPLLEEYVEVKKKLGKISFYKKKSTNNSNQRYKEIVQKYIDLVEKYFPNEFDVKIPKTNTIVQKKNNLKKNHNTSSDVNCSLCQRRLEVVVYDSHYCCKFCGKTTDQYVEDNLISFRDIERINIGSKYSYDRKQHFKETIRKFQGKQSCSNIPDDVYNKIINKLIQYKIIPSNYYDYPKEDAFKLVKRYHIKMILKELELGKFNEDLVYIYSKISGHKLPDISMLEAQILNDFDKLIKIYDETYAKTNRKNFLNNQYVLWMVLQRHGFRCEKEDFGSILKTNDRKVFHDTVFQDLFQQLGWNFTPLF